jgi:hypothetical protein
VLLFLNIFSSSPRRYIHATCKCHLDNSATITSYLTENTSCLHYKEQPVNSVCSATNFERDRLKRSITLYRCQMKRALSQTGGIETKDGSSSPASCLNTVTVFRKVLYSATVRPHDATWMNKGRETGSRHVCNSDYINIFTISRMSFFFTPSGRRCHWREKKYTENRTQFTTSTLCGKKDSFLTYIKDTRYSAINSTKSPVSGAM